MSEPCDAIRRLPLKTTEAWLQEHAEHGGIFDVTAVTDPPYMIRRACYCGAKHTGTREEPAP